jgi:hypothetical protein
VTSPNREVPMTLLEFIVSRHAGDNPRGDFIRDTREVQRLPRFGEGAAPRRAASGQAMAAPAEKRDELPPSYTDCHLTSPSVDHGRCNVGTISRLNRQVCDLLHGQIMLQCVSQLLACAVKRRRFPVGASPTRQPLQPEATGAVMEVTKWLKPSARRMHRA